MLCENHNSLQYKQAKNPDDSLLHIL